MANIKSAKKRINTIQRRREENRYVKATISTMIKKFRKLIEEGKIEEAEKYSKEVYSYVDSACSKGVIHRNNASRKIGRLAEALFKAKSTVVETKEEKPAKVEKVEEVKEEPKAEEKKVAKKTTTKKTTAKKADEEKKTEKKTTAKKATKKAE